MSTNNNTVTLFHCTSNAREENIVANGLLLSKSVSELHGAKPIFLSLTPQHCFGNTCFKVCIPKEWVTQTINHWEYTCDRDIPPAHITFFSYEEDE